MRSNVATAINLLNKLTATAVLFAALIMTWGGGSNLDSLAFVMASGTLCMLVYLDGKNERIKSVVRLLAILIAAVGIFFLEGNNVQAKVSFFLTGLSIFCLTEDEVTRKTGAQYAALIIAVSAMSSVVAYTYGLSYLFQLGYFSEIPLQSALLFLGIAAVIFFSHCQSGPAAVFLDPGGGGVIARRLLLPAWLTLPCLGFTTGVGQNFEIDLTILVMVLDLALPVSIWLLAARLCQQEAERMKAYEQLYAANQRLNDQTAQLLTSEVKMREALEARSRFIANISHELRTPLAVLINATELSLDTDLSPAQRQLMEITKEAGDSLLRLVNDLLDVARIDAQRVELAEETVSTRGLVEAALRAVEHRARAQQLTMETNFAEDVPESFVADAGRIKQILINLVDNAIKFTEQGRVLIQVSVKGNRDDESAPSYICFSVVDTGIGIAEEMQAQLFQPFFQLDSAATRKFAGAGLGLSICKSLMELMGGTISVTSKLGEGSTFSISVPIHADKTEPEETPAQKMDTDTKGSLILIVEDSKTNAYLLKMQLDKLGYAADIASSGVQSLQAIERQQYALVLMDWQMAEMDGIEATRAIRALSDPAKRNIPIIAVTAHALPEDHDTCIEAGMNDYLTKPASLAQIQEVLLRWSGDAAKEKGKKK